MENATEPKDDEERGVHLQAHGFWWEINPTFVLDMQMRSDTETDQWAVGKRSPDHLTTAVV